MSWYDEEIHYARSIVLSNGDLLTKQNNDNSKYGGDISSTQDTFIDRAFKSKLFDKEIDVINTDWENSYSDLTYTEKKTFRNSVTSMTNIPLIYMSYVSVAFFNKFLHLDVSTEFKLMKLIGFVISFVLIQIAVSRLPFAKLSLLLLTLVPPYFLGMASISADSIFLGAIPLFIALSLELFLNKKDSNLSWSSLLGYFVVALLVTVSKPPSCLLVSFVLLILWARNKTRKISLIKSIFLVLMVLSLAFITIYWLWLVRDVDPTKYFGSSGNMGEQLAFIMKHPVYFVKVLFHNMASYNFFGMQLGYAENPIYMQMPMFIGVVSAVAIIFSLFIDDTDKEVFIGRKDLMIWNIYSYLLCFGVFILIFTAGYLQSSQVGSNEIMGVQPRYFLPFWFLLFFIPNRLKISNKFAKNIVILSSLSAWLTYFIFVFLQF